MPTEAPDFSAVSSALGYLYQVRYALHLLLDADSDVEITLEKLDDVAFESKGTPAELLQFKHHIDKTASLTDGSSDVWKTLRVWSEGIHAKTPQFVGGRLLLVTTGIAADDSAAKALRSGEKRDVTTALKLLKEVAATSENQANRSAYTSFGKLTPEDQQQLLERVYVLDRAPDIGTVGSLIEKQVRLAAPEKHLKGFCERLEGWWVRRVISMWTAPGGITPISRRELQLFLDDLREQFQRENLPADFVDKVAVGEDELPVDGSLFLSQLRGIKVSSERIQDAMSDFFRAFEQRSRWVREELVWQSEIEQYEDRLLEAWRNLYYAMKEDADGLPADQLTQRARSFYNALIDTQRHLPIRANFTHPYVMRGSYHILANAPRLCWHPEWEHRLIGQPQEEVSK